jgi:hypothetical protein
LTVELSITDLELEFLDVTGISRGCADPDMVSGCLCCCGGVNAAGRVIHTIP